MFLGVQLIGGVFKVDGLMGCGTLGVIGEE